jgi:hypothetical protein
VEFQLTISEQLLVLTISAPVRRIERAGGLDAVLDIPQAAPLQEDAPE